MRRILEHLPPAEGAGDSRLVVAFVFNLITVPVAFRVWVVVPAVVPVVVVIPVVVGVSHRCLSASERGSPDRQLGDVVTRATLPAR